MEQSDNVTAAFKIVKGNVLFKCFCKYFNINST